MANPQFSVDGRHTIVTGSSSGIGRSVAERFAADGADISICSRSASEIEAVASEITNEAEGDVHGYPCDVRDRESVDRMVSQAVDRYGPVDVLVNNAGGDFSCPFDELSPNGWKSVVDVNLHGTFHFTQAVGESMRDAGGGAVVNVGSMYGITGALNHTHYSAAKAAILNLTEVLAGEWAPHDVRVNAVAPGFVMTPGFEDAVDEIDTESIHRETVQRRIGTPEEIADVIQFLASSASSYVTGSTITAKGAPDIETVDEAVERAAEQLR
jgi:NAD(P)-dependent dehydrogenase (short-subunit alcohol dehydrogenase family)